MLKKFFSALAVMIFIFSATQTTFASEFSGTVLKSTGIAMPPEGTNINSSFYKSFARQAATMDAFRCLLDALYYNFDEWIEMHNIPQNFTTRVIADDETVIEVEMNEKILNLFSKIEIVDVKFDPDGFCEVTVQGTLK